MFKNITKMSSRVNQKGIALLITMLLLGTMIATALGVAILTTTQTSITRLVDDSVSAVFAADSGIEKMLYACSYKIVPSPSPAIFTNLDMGNGAGYVVKMSPTVPATCGDSYIISTGSKGSVQRSFQAVSLP